MTDGNIELTRRKILGSLGAVGVAGAGAGLGTSAYFSDEETFTNNQLTAGELDLQVAWQEHYSNWKDDDYDPFPGEETTYAEMPDSPADADISLPPGPGQDGAAEAIELAFVDPNTPGDEGGSDSRPDEDDGGRQFLVNTQRQNVNGGIYGGPDSLCGTGADVPEDRALIEVGDLKPGDFGFALFRLELCTNPGFLWLDGSLVDASENGVNEPEAGDEDEDQVEGDGNPDLKDGESGDKTVELLDEIQVAYAVGATNDIAALDPEDNPLPLPTDGPGSTLQNQTTLREFLYLLEIGDGVLLDGDTPAEEGGGTGRNCFAGEEDHYLSVVWWLPIDHGNEVQSDSVTFDFGFYTEQCRHNDGSGDLIAYYPLDSVGDGTAEDLSGRGNDGTPNGVSSVDGKVGDAASFDGDDDYIQTPYEPSLSDPLTLSAWAYVQTAAQERRQVVSPDDAGFDWSLLYDEFDQWALFHGSGVLRGPQIATEQWTHVAGVWDLDASETRLYVDGTPEETGPITTGSTTNAFRIGDNPDFDENFNGWIDDVRIYGRALTDQEVQTLADL